MKILDYLVKAKKEGKSWADMAIYNFYKSRIKHIRRDKGKITRSDLEDIFNSSVDITNTGYILFYAFEWASTSEGYNYWHNVYHTDLLDENT